MELKWHGHGQWPVMSGDEELLSALPEPAFLISYPWFPVVILNDKSSLKQVILVTCKVRRMKRKR